MTDPDAYIALVTSLPNPERLFLAKQPPISRLRLDRRLRALETEHRALLAEIEAVMNWKSYGMGDNDQLIRLRVKPLLAELETETLRAIVLQRMDLRATIAALRLRRDGKAAPAITWAQCRLTRHIVANWSDPTFKLDSRLPWIRDVAQLLEKKAPQDLERYILDVTYRQLKRHGANHHFDFEAVVIYVLKWNIFDRWARSDARAAADRFETLTQEALGDFAELELKGAL